MTLILPPDFDFRDVVVIMRILLSTTMSTISPTISGMQSAHDNVQQLGELSKFDKEPQCKEDRLGPPSPRLDCSSAAESQSWWLWASLIWLKILWRLSWCSHMFCLFGVRWDGLDLLPAAQGSICCLLVTRPSRWHLENSLGRVECKKSQARDPPLSLQGIGLFLIYNLFCNLGIPLRRMPC